MAGNPLSGVPGVSEKVSDEIRAVIVDIVNQAVEAALKRLLGELPTGATDVSGIVLSGPIADAARPAISILQRIVASTCTCAYPPSSPSSSPSPTTTTTTTTPVPIPILTPVTPSDRH